MCHYCCFNNQDELFRALSSFKQIAPRYRWHRSRWGQACPVALKEGDIVMGDPELAVRLVDFGTSYFYFCFIIQLSKLLASLLF